ncbi:molybdopterin-synthase adenylyltransferase MoeB [Emticicia sp. CRIBPO]|uniref:molybdopterin-synthase adenylyltransferase MoeB n=1 Tax=Emticicia sp. CRIBPO TaxID=2683258 RepID=UPI001411BF4F|nr:molybdopterin-synthase adenylyltransferase MoeB [Emticicia sp. CRIBPO]NBA86621.1 molybdopterin-synthase adenylyltransferase MoeB [Emticicia sp. CRIBPO]
MDLSTDDFQRYQRQIILPELGEAGQKRLKEAKVLIIGCGGLGSPVILYLAAAGVGNIGLVEYDKVEKSNLHRQILYKNDAVGQSKIELAARSVAEINPGIRVTQHAVRLDRYNVLDIFRSYDLIVDGSDNFPTRYLVNDACEILGKPYVYGAIHRFEGQVGVFNHQDSSTYRDLFPEPPPPEMAPNCAEAGVLGVIAGLIGSMQANEALKILGGFGQPLAGELFIIDALTLFSRKFRIPKIADRPKVIELIDYEVFCQVSQVNEITLEELERWQAEDKDFQLVDVREPNEYEANNLEGELIPLDEIEDRRNEIRKDIPVVIHCQTGLRSSRAISILKEKFGFDNLINLKGGISG